MDIRGLERGSGAMYAADSKAPRFAPVPASHASQQRCHHIYALGSGFVDCAQPSVRRNTANGADCTCPHSGAFCTSVVVVASVVAPHVTPNHSLESTADRREKEVEMLSRLAVEMKPCALVSGRSACSR